MDKVKAIKTAKAILKINSMKCADTCSNYTDCDICWKQVLETMEVVCSNDLCSEEECTINDECPRRITTVIESGIKTMEESKMKVIGKDFFKNDLRSDDLVERKNDSFFPYKNMASAFGNLYENNLNHNNGKTRFPELDVVAVYRLNENGAYIPIAIRPVETPMLTEEEFIAKKKELFPFDNIDWDANQTKAYIIFNTLKKEFEVYYTDRIKHQSDDHYFDTLQHAQTCHELYPREVKKYLLGIEV